LHSIAIENQIKVAQLEQITKVPIKFRYPFFTEINWYALQKYVHFLTDKNYLRVDENGEAIRFGTDSFSKEVDPNQKINTEFTLSRINSNHIHPATYEINGLKLIIKYLSKLPKSRQNIPDLITSGPALLTEAKQFLASYKSKENCIQCGNKPILYFLSQKFYRPNQHFVSNSTTLHMNASTTTANLANNNQQLFAPLSRPFSSIPHTTAGTLTEIPNSFAHLIETTGINAKPKLMQTLPTVQPQMMNQPSSIHNQQVSLHVPNNAPLSNSANLISNVNPSLPLPLPPHPQQQQAPPPGMYFTQLPGGMITSNVWPPSGFVQMPNGQLIAAGRPVATPNPMQQNLNPSFYEVMPVGQSMMHPLRPGYPSFAFQSNSLHQPMNLMQSNPPGNVSVTTSSLPLIMNNVNNPQHVLTSRPHQTMNHQWPQHQSFYSPAMMSGLMMQQSTVNPNMTHSQFAPPSMSASHLQPNPYQVSQMSAPHLSVGGISSVQLSPSPVHLPSPNPSSNRICSPHAPPHSNPSSLAKSQSPANLSSANPGLVPQQHSNSIASGQAFGSIPVPSTTFASPTVQRISCKQCAACLSAACGACHTCIRQSQKLGNVKALSAVGVGCERIQCTSPVLPLDARCGLCGKDGWQQMLLGPPGSAQNQTPLLQLGAKCSLMQCLKCGILTHPECLRQRTPHLQHINPIVNTTLSNSWQCAPCVLQQQQQQMHEQLKHQQNTLATVPQHFMPANPPHISTFPAKLNIPIPEPPPKPEPPKMTIEPIVPVSITTKSVAPDMKKKAKDIYDFDVEESNANQISFTNPVSRFPFVLYFLLRKFSSS
jgi:hypothetical protein